MFPARRRMRLLELQALEIRVQVWPPTQKVVAVAEAGAVFMGSLPCARELGGTGGRSCIAVTVDGTG